MHQGLTAFGPDRSSSYVADESVRGQMLRCDVVAECVRYRRGCRITELSSKSDSHTLTIWALDPSVTLHRFGAAFIRFITSDGPVPEIRASNK